MAESLQISALRYGMGPNYQQPLANNHESVAMPTDASIVEDDEKTSIVDPLDPESS